jgi:hypothetical protein
LGEYIKLYHRNAGERTAKRDSITRYFTSVFKAISKKIELGLFSAAKTFSRKKSEYLHEFESKIENILGL